jgi:hypothetical protein
VTLLPQLLDDTNYLWKYQILSREEIAKMNTYGQFKQKMHLDMTFDKSMLKVLAFMVAAILIIYTLCLQTPECKILFYLILYLGFTILYIKDRTQVEIDSHMIIIHRPIFNPIIINKKDITKIQINKNTNFSFHRIQFIFLIALIVALAYNSFYDLLNGIKLTVTMASSLILILHESWIIFMLIIIILNISKRIPYHNLVIVNTEKSNFIFYSKQPEELKRIIETQET